MVGIKDEDVFSMCYEIEGGKISENIDREQLLNHH